MRLLFLSLFLSGFLSGCATSFKTEPLKPTRSQSSVAQSPGSQSVTAGTLETALEKIRVDGAIPALAAMQIKNGAVIQKAVVGVRKWGDPTLAQISDPFHLGSDTKAMTATLFAMFVEQNKVRWDSTLESLFPEIRNMHSDFKNVTVEMLLAHRSGLAVVMDPQYLQEMRSFGTRVQVGRKIFTENLLSRAPSKLPGSEFIYSNSNYIIVGRIIEKLTGQSWEKVITTRLFKPLGMKSCGFGPAGNARAKIPDAPWPHLDGPNSGGPNSEGPIPLKPNWNADNPPVLGPAGTVHCSLEDWGKFLQLHLDGSNHKPTKILNAVSFDKMHETYPGQDYTYGGWFKVDGPIIFHDGSNTMNYARALLIPEINSALMVTVNKGGDAAQNAVTAAISELMRASRNLK